jgi:hypothetical protein
LTAAGPGDTIARVKNLLTLFAASIVAVAACGARTGLRLVHSDAGADGTGGTGGVAPDAGPDVVDAGPDVVDAPPDAPPDVIVDDCVDAGITYIYLIGSDNNMYRFDPYTQPPTTQPLGMINCPGEDPNDPNTGPNSMAVDRAGIAYVNFQDGQVFRVSTATLSCEPTGFQPGQRGFPPTYGMAFSADVTDPGEKLYVAGLDTPTEELATIDTTTFQLAPVGMLSHVIGDSELTGTGSGDLYAFGVNSMSGIFLARLDKATAGVVSEGLLSLSSGGAPIFAWAFAAWGGDFYFFTSTDGMTSDVSLYTPGGALTLPVVTTITQSAIVGAGVSTCAPVQ